VDSIFSQQQAMDSIKTVRKVGGKGKPYQIA